MHYLCVIVCLIFDVYQASFVVHCIISLSMMWMDPLESFFVEWFLFGPWEDWMRPHLVSYRCGAVVSEQRELSVNVSISYDVLKSIHGWLTVCCVL